MSKILLESESFITTNLKTVINRKAQDNISSTNQQLNTTTGQEIFNNNEIKEKKDLKKDSNWKQELEDRLKGNRQATPELKKDESEVIKEFWYDCFTTLWPADLYENLNALGISFKEDLLNWGFSKTRNPMIAFINQKFVQNNLVKTKYLNINTYKALHNAIVHKLIKFEEFISSNDYDIIYCLDLYTKTPADIYNYLKLQHNILLYKEKKAQAITDNKRVFLDLKIKATDPNKIAERQSKVADKSLPSVKKAEILDLNIAIEVAKLLGYIENSQSSSISTVKEVKDNSASDLVKNLELSEVSTLLTYIYANTRNKEIINFLNSHKDTLQKAEKGISTEFIEKLGKSINTGVLSEKGLIALLQAITDKFFSN